MSKLPNISKIGKNGLYVLIAVLTLASFAYHIMGRTYVKETSILFVGLPALIAIFIVRFTNTPKSSYGVVLRALTLFLLLASIALGEGTVCIIMASPIFYGVAALSVYIYEWSKKQYPKNKNMNALAPLPILLVLAQPFGLVNPPSLQTVVVQETIDRHVTLEALNSTPNVMENFPSTFKMGFPIPQGIEGTGLEIGDTRTIPFLSSTRGLGNLTLQIVEKSDSHLVFSIPQDNTHMGRWLTWEEVRIELTHPSPNQTQITWSSSYTCDLGPQWYFETIEKQVVGVMNQHLIDSYFKSVQ